MRSLAPEKLNASLPKGYRIDVGGTVEESAASQASVYAKVPLMLFLMLLFLMAQLHSFSRLALVLSVVPMGLIGNGLFVATMLTLIVLPALYVAWFRVNEPAREPAPA